MELCYIIDLVCYVQDGHSLNVCKTVLSVGYVKLSQSQNK